MAKQKKKKRSPLSQLPRKKPAMELPRITAQSAQYQTDSADNGTYSGEPGLEALKSLFAANRREAFLRMLTDIDLADPENAPHLPEFGNMLMKAQDFDSAATVFRAWSEVEPDNAKAFNSLGTALVSGNWLEAGHDALSKAVALQPGQEIYQFNLAKLFMVRGLWEQAKSMLLNLKHTFPGSAAKVDELLQQFPEQG